LGEKYEKGKRKKGKMQDKKEEKGKKKRNKKEEKGKRRREKRGNKKQKRKIRSKRVKTMQNREELRQIGVGKTVHHKGGKTSFL
jgi:sRNA-binding protein